MKILYTSKRLYLIGVPVMFAIMYITASYEQTRIEKNFEAYITGLKNDEIHFFVDKNFIDSHRHSVRVMKFKSGEEWLFPPLKIFGIELDSVQYGDQIHKSAGSFEIMLLRHDGRKQNGELGW